MLTALAFLSILAAPRLGSVSPKTVEAKIPGHPTEISIDVPGFEPADYSLIADRMHSVDALGEQRPDEDSTLLLGALDQDVWLWVSWVENFPALPSESLVQPLSRTPGLTTFSVKDIAGFEFRLKDRGIVLQTLFEAFPASQDFMFSIRVVVESLTAEDLLSGKRDAEKFPRTAFTKLVKSFRVRGNADRKALMFPPEAYAFRDEAAKIAGDPSGWIRKQCAARPEEWAPEFYLGQVARIQDKPELAVAAFTRAAQLLEARTERDDKQTLALAGAWSGNSWASIRKKDFAGAIPLCERVLGVAKPDAVGMSRRLRADALYDAARACAQTGETGKAIQRLKEAVELQPAWKERAGEDELFKPLRKTKEFESLVGN